MTSIRYASRLQRLTAVLCMLAAIWMASPARAGAPADVGAEDIRSLWRAPADHPFRRALEEGAGFSFTYDGAHVGPSLPSSWKVESGGAETRFRHPSGLAVIRRTRVFPESSSRLTGHTH